MERTLLPGNTVGIVGGGELSRMLVLAGQKMGLTVGVLDPQVNAPAAQVADFFMQVAYTDEENLKNFIAKCDVWTYTDREEVVEALSLLEGKVAFPYNSTFSSLTQDRLLEKAFLEEMNMNTAPYATIVDMSDIKKNIDSIGYPCVLKKASGKKNRQNGQQILYSDADIPLCEPLLQTGTCMLEAWIPFERELSVIVGRNPQNEITMFPVVEEVYRFQHMHETIVPARINEDVRKEVQRVAVQLVKSLEMTGTMTVSFFLTSAGALYVDSISVGPQEGGTYSVDACNVSQYMVHLQGVSGWPLTQVKLWSPAVTVNILGKHLVDTYTQVMIKRDWFFNYYHTRFQKSGKIEDNDLVGHITILTKDIKATLENIYNTNIWD